MQRRGAASLREDFVRSVLALAVWVFTLVHAAHAGSPALTLSFGDKEQRYTAEELLTRPDADTISIANDPAYGTAMSYRAVPLLALLRDRVPENVDTIEARALDGFVSQLPLALIVGGSSAGGSVAFVAIEDPKKPWPPLPGKTASAGPFYLVWEHPERSAVSGEQWPYQLAALTGVESPVHRWPQMAAPSDLPADAPARRGQAVFIANCLPCHRIKGAGMGELGPDLGEPMSPTQYFTADALRRLIRDPKSVRTWPRQVMPGFSRDKLSDDDLNAVIAYLAALAPAQERR
jgi:mono/diheme cytochrome c family protein